MSPANSKKKALVALSGGVDSSVAAALLLQAGYDCAGVFMVTSDQGRHAESSAQEVADKLSIKLHVLDLRKEFDEIIDHFTNEYRKSRTPNPCVVCNRQIKFGKLWEFAQTHGADALATGHYAKILPTADGPGLFAAAAEGKDQSYALAMIRREMLGHVRFPLGEYSKEQTRKAAEQLGLGTAEREESQEICFVPKDDYVALVEQRCPEIVRPGNVVDGSGKVLGRHSGTHRFTIGQRRGLGIAMGEPYYVTNLDAPTNTVTLGPKQALLHRRLTASHVNWLIDRRSGSFRAKVKIRYNSKAAPATVTVEDDRILVEFDQPVLAITPGQLATVYIDSHGKSRVAGGAWIDTVV